MTYESKDIIATMIRGNGVYPDDPQAYQIYSYRHAISGKLLYAVYMSPSHVDIFRSPYVGSPIILLWSRLGITLGGKEFLQSIAEEERINEINGRTN